MTRLETRGCRPWRRTLLRYVDAELDAAGRLQLEAHLADCPSCEAALGFHLRIEELLHVDAGLEPDREFDDRVVAGVFGRIDDRDEQEARRAAARGPRRTGRRAAGVALAAVAAAAGVLAVLDARRGRSPEPREAPSVVAWDTTPPNVFPTPVTPRPREDAIVPSRLAAARATVDRALREAEEADDYRAAFQRRTAPLLAEAWPVEEIVIKAITAEDADAARRAIRAASELSIDGAVPALRRAARRAPTAGDALVALGALRDGRSLDRLVRGLTEPALREAAADGLARLGTPGAVAALGDALADPTQEETAVRALLQMGLRGVGELVRRRTDGDAVAARALFDHDLPSGDDVLRLIDATAFAEEVVAAALTDAPSVGPRALPALSSLIAHPTLGADAVEATVRIGGTAALRALAEAPAPPEESGRSAACEAFLARAIQRVVRDDPGTAATIHEIVRGPAGDRLLAALDGRSAALADGLGAVFTDRAALAGHRAVAALSLAAADRFDARNGLAAVFEVALVDEDAAARVLCAAARAGATPADAGALAPLARPTAEKLLRRAAVIAARWRDDGEPPQPWERRGLVKLLSQAVPRL